MRLSALALNLVVFALPLSGEAQQAGKLWRIGCLETGFASGRAQLWEAFRQGLRELGYVESQSITLDFRWADGDAARARRLAKELVALEVDVLVASGTPAAQAARQATNTIPIVMSGVGDPVALRLVTSLAHPGGNMTGVTTLSGELSGKRVELLREVVPKLRRLGFLWDLTNEASTLNAKETKDAARLLGLDLQAVGVRAPGDFDGAFSAMTQKRAGALVVQPCPIFFATRRRLADLARMNRLPTMFGQREYAEAGGLLAYGANLAAGFRQAATYVDKILKGAKPADLPVEQPAKFELVVNLKTGKALGRTIPRSVLLRADEVIQ
jgi:putative ABC transport system substrate-binding protein